MSSSQLELNTTRDLDTSKYDETTNTESSIFVHKNNGNVLEWVWFCHIGATKYACDFTLSLCL